MKALPCNFAGRILPALSAVVLLLMISPAASAADIRKLWQSRDQYVALESRDAGSDGKPASNSHPHDISQERLAAMLSSIEVRTSDSSGVQPLFTKPALETLVPELQGALRTAGPGDDVTFAAIGLHSALFGLAKSPRVTTGRMFVAGGRLNIIFGLVQQDFNEREDRRISPFTPGTRSSAASGDWRLLPGNGEGMTIVRRDWVAFGEGWKAPAVPAAAPAAATDRAAQPVKRSEETRTPAERLSTLKELSNKGLITDEEYRAKRLEILNGL